MFTYNLPSAIAWGKIRYFLELGGDYGSYLNDEVRFVLGSQ
jgi:hypothetical protein